VTLHDFKVETAEGEERPLADFRGKTVLVVNTASRCGLTPQYEGLQKLRELYAGRGFEVLAFPANDFLFQEPGSNAQIQEFCSTKFGVTFPVFAKIHVKGKAIAPVYEWLTNDTGHDGDIEWNFAKFLVGPDGNVIARFHPKVDPLAPEVTAAVESTLPA
jgi:glutathione peroxidase